VIAGGCLKEGAIALCIRIRLAPVNCTCLHISSVLFPICVCDVHVPHSVFVTKQPAGQDHINGALVPVLVALILISPTGPVR